MSEMYKEYCTMVLANLHKNPGICYGYSWRLKYKEVNVLKQVTQVKRAWSRWQSTYPFSIKILILRASRAQVRHRPANSTPFTVIFCKRNFTSGNICIYNLVSQVSLSAQNEILGLFSYLLVPKLQHCQSKGHTVASWHRDKPQSVPGWGNW